MDDTDKGHVVQNFKGLNSLHAEKCFVSADTFQYYLFYQNKLSGITSECQTVCEDKIGHKQAKN